MSFYGMVFGQNDRSDAILATLGLKKEDVGRFRDCIVTEGKIAVYTRNGGGNRDHWDSYETPEGMGCGCPGCIISYRIRKHPQYLTDRDDDFDRTYATIYFSFPPEHAEELAKLDTGEPFEPSARWLAAIAALRGQP
jgi:hypothetical protein